MTYDQLKDHYDAECIINTTPVGMYPNNGEAVIDLALFPRCCAVLDVIYNPLKTALLLSARERGIPSAGGLAMLVAQAKRSSELFTGQTIDEQKIEEIFTKLRRELMNIVLIGMPGCGKTEVGRLVARRMCREHLDVDDAVLQKTGMHSGTMIERQGEPAFRRLETEVIRELGKQTSKVISTGGGSVLAGCNYAPLAQNSLIFFVERSLESLAVEGRPLSSGADTLPILYRCRLPLYQKFSNHRIDNNALLEQAADTILEVFYETAGD